jgi:hypothetical protein
VKVYAATGTLSVPPFLELVVSADTDLREVSRSLR